MKKLRFHHLKPSPGSTKQKLRKGRGESGKRGKTAGRGVKGQKSRSGVSIKGFEGGQMPRRTIDGDAYVRGVQPQEGRRGDDGHDGLSFA